MRKIFILIALVCSAAISSNIRAQQTPPGAGDKDLRDTNVKARSVEMERIAREAKKIDKSAAENPAAIAEDKLAVKYDEIKMDYEQIQLSQDTVIKTYQGAGVIDYVQIRKSALEINKSATRLNSNLFPPNETTGGETDERKENKKDKETKSAQRVRDLIVDLDNAIGSFATSPMFQNLRAVDAAVSEKAKMDLERIIELGALLVTEAEKMKRFN